MVIRRSAAAEIRQLVDRLVGGDAVEREAALARLAIIGTRATRTLTAALAATRAPAGQTAILRTLDAIGDPHCFAPVSQMIDAFEPEVAAAAVGVLRGFLRSRDAALANAAFERLTSATLDPTRLEPVRAAALEALSDLPAETTDEVLRQLEHDASGRLRGVAVKPPRVGVRPIALAELTEVSRCPEPLVLRGQIAAEGRSVPLPVLGKLVEMIRRREEGETASSRRTEWQAARAAAHQALAERGSRLALYDLRESLAVVPGPLPVGFVAALQSIGDSSCLDDLAAAFVRARRARDGWWTEHLAAVFKAILQRERLTRRSAALKRMISKHPQAAEELLPKGR